MFVTFVRPMPASVMTGNLYSLCMSVSRGGTARGTEFSKVMGSKKRGRKLRTSERNENMMGEREERNGVE